MPLSTFATTENMKLGGKHILTVPSIVKPSDNIIYVEEKYHSLTPVTLAPRNETVAEACVAFVARSIRCYIPSDRFIDEGTLTIRKTTGRFVTALRKNERPQFHTTVAPKYMIHDMTGQ